MIIRVFYTEISSQIMPDIHNKLLESFPENIKARIKQYTGEKERQLRIAGKALLVYALKQLNLYPAVSLDNYAYSITNQPVLKGSDVNFSITHSSNMILCAVVQGEGEKIGIDVERMNPVKLDLMKFYFNPASWEEIINAPDYTAAFYRHWTMKEAAIKASGLSIEQMELSEILTEDDTIQLREEIYYSRILSLKYDYMVCVASDKPVDDLELTELSMEDLL
jgi:4'-phosphopantetheinyl transferase